MIRAYVMGPHNTERPWTGTQHIIELETLRFARLFTGELIERVTLGGRFIRAMCGNIPDSGVWAHVSTDRTFGAMHCKPCDDAALSRMGAPVRSRTLTSDQTRCAHLFERLTLALNALQIIRLAERFDLARAIAENALVDDQRMQNGPADLTEAETERLPQA